MYKPVSARSDWGRNSRVRHVVMSRLNAADELSRRLREMPMMGQKIGAETKSAISMDSYLSVDEYTREVAG